MAESRVVGERFELRAFVGAGGFGDVWQAVDTRTHALVAVKFLRRPDRVERARFHREVAILKALDHPAIVPLIAHGEGADGIPYLVMPWLEGETLGRRLARGTLTAEETRTLAIRIAEALAYAHDKGIIHRDLKPANLFLVGARIEAVRVLDFGLARTAPSSKLTATGLAVGTPGYMAPETARGDRTFDGRVDTYSLGCVLFRCLVGRDVFYGQAPVVVLLRAAHEAPPRVRQIRPEVTPYLDELVDALLSRDRERRPTAMAVLEFLAKRTAPPTLHPIGPLPLQWHAFALLRPLPSVTLEELEEAAFREKERRIDAIVSAEGARLEVLLDGSMLLLPNGGLPPVEQVRALARLCLGLRYVMIGTGFAIVGDPAEGPADTTSLLDAGNKLLIDLDRPIVVVDLTCVPALQGPFELTHGAGAAVLVGPAAGHPLIAHAPASHTQPDLEIPHVSPTLSDLKISRWSWLSFALGFVLALVLVAVIHTFFPVATSWLHRLDRDTEVLSP